MSLNARENINGITPQDLNKMNNNFMSIWKTLFGGLDFSDTNNNLKKKIQTQQMPVQGESNFDMNFPAYIRFFVPTNTKEITSTSFNFICERYRMDSGIAMDGGSVIDAPIQMSLASSTTGVASVSSPTVGVSSVSNSSVYGASTAPVYSWYFYSSNGDKIGRVPPTKAFGLLQSGDATANTYTDFVTGKTSDGSNLSGVKVRNVPSNIGSVSIIDLAYLNHEHEFEITTQPHTHSITMQPHSHSISLQPHTHEANAKITLPEHNHKLKEGIQISNSDALGVNVKLNGNVIATLDSMSNSIKNNVDAKDFVKIGEWNTIECTTQNLARITIYGIIELVMNY